MCRCRQGNGVVWWVWGWLMWPRWEWSGTCKWQRFNNERFARSQAFCVSITISNRIALASASASAEWVHACLTFSFNERTRATRQIETQDPVNVLSVPFAMHWITSAHPQASESDEYQFYIRPGLLSLYLSILYPLSSFPQHSAIQSGLLIFSYMRSIKGVDCVLHMSSLLLLVYTLNGDRTQIKFCFLFIVSKTK